MVNEVRSFDSGKSRVRIFDSLADMAKAAADEAAELIEKAVASNGIANVMFATGNSQIAFIDELVGRQLPWQRVVGFHMDEYVGLSSDHSASFQKWIKERIADRVKLEAIHYFDGSQTPEVECNRYAKLLASHPLDICCLGIGENGHLAFNDPGVAFFDDPEDVKVVELDEKCKRQQVNEGHFPDLDHVPAKAMTVTVPALLRATNVLAIVPDERKAEPVKAAIEGPLDEMCPASSLRNSAGTTIYLDAGSSSLLNF